VFIEDFTKAANITYVNILQRGNLVRNKTVSMPQVLNWNF